MISTTFAPPMTGVMAMCADIPIAVPVVPWQPPMNDTMRRFPVAIGNSRPTVSLALEPGSPSQTFFSNPPGTGETSFPASSTAGACIPETSPAKALRPSSPTIARRTRTWLQPVLASARPAVKSR